uniref:Peptidase M20 domain-containing protein 2 n=1 Tax=Strigamia maritima TaxID=126957 RepID=T1J257_STRMM
MEINMEVAIRKAIETEKENLASTISTPIWNHPELGFEEHHAHDLLTNYLEKNDFKVQRNYILQTAFRAEYGYLGNDAKYTICVMCEYDALPDIGHACGHNLIAEAGIAAAIGIKAAVNFQDVKGKLVVMGTPAEEGGGGKSILIAAGALKGVDVAMMVHPGPYDVLGPRLLAVERLQIQYLGKAAHASLAPWEGVNALDAAVICYSSIAFGRQHMRPNCRVHGIITNGGAKPNITPSETELLFYIRASENESLDVLKKSVLNSAEGAAISTGCEMKYEFQPHGYESFRYIPPLQNLYKGFAEKLGNLKTKEKKSKLSNNYLYEEKYKDSFMGSTDMGNVSQVVPSIHPIYSIKTTAANHTKEFADAAGHDDAQNPTLTAAICMALSAYQLFTDESLQHQVKMAFKTNE